MSKVQGTLAKAYKNKGGFWSISVNETWYGTGKTDHSNLEGQEVEFEASKNKRGYFDVDGKIVVVSTPEPAAKGTTPRSSGSKESSIVLQSSYKTAGEVVAAAIAAGAVPLPTKKADQLDAILGYVDEAAYHIFTNCIDPTDFLASRAPAGPGPDADDDYDPTEA